MSKDYGDDLIVMGDMGVLLRAGQTDPDVNDFRHDVEAFVTVAAYLDIRDAYEVFLNRQMHKALVMVDGVEVGLYLEHQNRLRFDFGNIAFRAGEIEGIQVASLEHLLFLKLTTAGDRWSSSHGSKDQRDIAKILLLLENMEPEIGLSAATDTDLRLLESVLSSTAFMELAQQDAGRAKNLEQRAKRYARALRE